MWKKNFTPNKVGVRDSKSHIDKERNLSRHFATMHTDAQKNETLCAIWYHLHNLKSMKKRSDTFSKLADFSLQLYYK